MSITWVINKGNHKGEVDGAESSQGAGSGRTGSVNASDGES